VRLVGPIACAFVLFSCQRTCLNCGSIIARSEMFVKHFISPMISTRYQARKS